MFRSAFKRRRCIVPASGYYEWRPADGGKQPYFIGAADGAVLSIAGLWDEWRDPETREPVLSATLIVTAANDFTRSIHDRMLSANRIIRLGEPERPVLSSCGPRRTICCACGRSRNGSMCQVGETMT